MAQKFYAIKNTNQIMDYAPIKIGGFWEHLT